MGSTASDVWIKDDLGYEAVMGIIQRHIKTEVEWSQIERLDVIGIDEISLRLFKEWPLAQICISFGLLMGIASEQKRGAILHFIALKNIKS